MLGDILELKVEALTTTAVCLGGYFKKEGI